MAGLDITKSTGSQSHLQRYLSAFKTNWILKILMQIFYWDC